MPKSDSETTLSEDRPTELRARTTQSGPALLLGVVGVIALFALAGCPGTLENAQVYNIADPNSTAGSSSGSTSTGGGAAVTPGLNVSTDCLVATFNMSCAMVGCHKSGPAAGAGLDLESPGVNQRLINVAATHKDASPSTGCGMGDKLIDASNPSKSWLLGKLSTDGSTCGFKMPIGAPLSDTATSCINKYVQDVAAAASGSTGGATGAAGTTGSAGSSGAATAGAGTGGAPATAGGGGT